MDDWRPLTSFDVLRKRAELFAAIRRFFSERSVLEVDVPILGDHGVTDLHIDSITTISHGSTQFLQTSPEYFMKRLLASGSGDIYSLGKVFRSGEAGRRHNPEFTMLEWYRVDWDEHQLMDEAISVARLAMGDLPVTKGHYSEFFRNFVHCDPHTVELSVLRRIAAQAASVPAFMEDRSTCLDLIFSLLVEPRLPKGLVAVYDYPACQSALAQIGEDSTGQQVARRFELFVNGMELANGYFELRDAAELRERFTRDILARQQANKAAVSMDEKLLAAMESGLPVCAGVAMGIDRLLMSSLQADSITRVISFTG